MKKKIIILTLLLLPFNVLAYSDKLIIEGKQVGIEAHSKGVYVIDLYKLDGKYPKEIKKGDLIEEINNNKISNINDINNIINKPGTYNLKIKRNSNNLEIKLKVDTSLKTGIYYKDQINGIGTLSYIDPETKVYASLGHEILENTSMTKFNLKNGYIYDIDINNINKNTNSNIGEFKGTFTNTLIGTIEKNEINGIYGIYTENIENEDLVEISDKITNDKAYLRLKIDNNELKDYEIDIININEDDPTKNIYFEIIDEELLDLTGGVIQGMSGTPIIQNNKIIGVVNYVIVDDNKKGYGIFIKTMLEEGDKILNN